MFRPTLYALKTIIMNKKLNKYHVQLCEVEHRGYIDSNELKTIEFALGLKLLSEVILRDRSNPLFKEFLPKFKSFMNKLKSGV